MKEYIKALSTLPIPYGGVHQWPMESPHKGPTMRKASILHLQGWTCLLVCLQHYGKTNYTQQWPHVSILGFRLTGNSDCLFYIAYRQYKQKNLKFRITDRLRGEPTDDQWSRHTKGQQCDKWPVYQNTCDICQNTTEIQRSRKYRWKFKKKHRQPR